jgi:ribonuclease BN (tRNA processing enzyme)
VAPLRELVRLAYPGGTFDALDDVCRFVPLPDDREQTTKVEGDLALSTRPAIHAVPTLSLRLDWGGHSVTYSADTAPSPALAGFAAGSDILLHEANFSATLDPNVELADHSTPRAAGAVATQAGVKTLVLLHIHKRYAGQEHVLYAEARETFAGNVLIVL